MAESNKGGRPMGIGQHSYTEAWKPNSGAKFHDALTFLEYAHSIGAAGVQVVIKPDEQPNAAKIRARAEELGVYFEGNVTLPKSDAEAGAFDAHIQAINVAGGIVARTACLGGRRYETFKSPEEFRDFKETSIKALKRAEPILRKHKVKLAIENHKDWLVAEQVEILRSFSSEWIGALIDTGNSLALLESPYDVIEALSPFAFSSHVKDMAMQEYQDGFLLSEVPMPNGYLDLPRVFGMLSKANPKIRFNLEMMTRDPLKIPCLTEAYYKPFAQMNGSSLAATLTTVKQNAAAKLPHTTGLTAAERLELEDRNVRECVTWANANIPA